MNVPIDWPGTAAAVAHGEYQPVPLTPSVSVLKRQLTPEQLRKATVEATHGAAATDLVPQVYEGGLKLWEGAVDLARFLVADASSLQLQPQPRVLEIGAGHGLPGIVAMRQGAACVHFQDFNASVLTLLTAPNVLANSSNAETAAATTGYIAGEWTAVAGVLAEQATEYDLVLTAETLYSESSHASLAQLLSQALAPGGVALIATKVLYFGVGGGLDSFQDYLEENQAMHCLGELTVLREIADGSNLRVVAMIKRR